MSQQKSIRMNNSFKVVITLVVLGAVGFVAYAFMPSVTALKYDTHVAQVDKAGLAASELLGGDETTKEQEAIPPPEKPTEENVVVTHIETPKAVKGIYISSWVAGSPNFFAKLVKMVDTTELNAVVIDVKDSTGKLSFPMSDPEISKYNSAERRISKPKTMVADLHAKGIYVIARVAVFQDPYMAKSKPEWAIKSKSTGTAWKDYKGLSFLDPSNEEVREYVVRIAKEAYAMGFDEINFDYIRFPSDGNMKDIAYPNEGGTLTRADIMKNFYSALHEDLKDTDIVTSADLFGLVTTATDDLGIGQVLENALPYFDYICPMTYPSHYAKGTYNIAEPAKHPYEILKTSMTKAVERAQAIGEDSLKLRPWLQDFDLGATYTKDMVRAQITATYDSGLTSWLLWDAANEYTPSALLAE